MQIFTGELNGKFTGQGKLALPNKSPVSFSSQPPPRLPCATSLLGNPAAAKPAAAPSLPNKLSLLPASRPSASTRLESMASSPAAEPSSDIAPESGAAEKPQVQPLRLPSAEEIRGQDIWNNCAVRSVVSGVMGGGLGLAMGLLLGALENPVMQEQMTGRQQFVYTAKQMGRKSWSSAKTFAVMGFVFSAAECVVEKARAKHDTTNTVIAGCATGGALSAKGGPKAACVGCAGFAAFSVVIEKFLDSHS